MLIVFVLARASIVERDYEIKGDVLKQVNRKTTLRNIALTQSAAKGRNGLLGVNVSLVDVELRARQISSFSCRPINFETNQKTN